MPAYPLDYPHILLEILKTTHDIPTLSHEEVVEHARQWVWHQHRDNRKFQLHRPTDEQFFRGVMLASLALNVRLLDKASEGEE